MSRERDRLRLAVNGVVHEVAGDDAFLTLSSWLRERLRLVGTKIVCSEGDCGACTVLAGTPDAGRLAYRAIDSCIAFLWQLDGCHVLTVDGLANGEELHPAQSAMAESFGSQCGYCTPGFVMALAGLTEEARTRGARCDERELRIGLSGNLCRCTGYVQILDAARAIDVDAASPLADRYDEQALVAALAGARNESVRVEAGPRSISVPASWREALALRAREPDAAVVAGATDFGVQLNKGKRPPARIVHLRPTLDGYGTISVGDGALRLGAGARWTELLERTRSAAPELAEILERFGAPQIRNAATIGGNLVNASPIADSLPWLYASEATVELESVRGRRTLPIAEFYLGYKRLDLAPDELVAAVVVPLPSPNETLRLLKVSRRRDLDISTFTAALWLKRSGERVESARIAFGGVGPTVVRVPEAEALLCGAPFELASFRAAGERAAAVIRPISDVRGSEATRRLLARNALLHFFHELSGAAAPTEVTS